METLCGIDCTQCKMSAACPGCAETHGRPFGGDCMLAACPKREGLACRQACPNGLCALKAQLIEEFNALGIEDMETVTDLNALAGSYINLEYTLPSGQTFRLWDDRRVYLGNQLCKKGSERCYGLTADERYLLVCEYGQGGADPEIVVFKRR